MAHKPPENHGNYEDKTGKTNEEILYVKLPVQQK